MGIITRLGMPKREVPSVVPVFMSLYEKLANLDLHREKGLHGSDEIIGMLETASVDDSFRFLARNTHRRIVLPIAWGENFLVDKNTDFYYLTFCEDFRQEDREWRQRTRMLADNNNLDLKIVRNGLLNYVRFAPLDEPFRFYSP